MEREPEHPEPVESTDDHDDEPPPYEPDPRLMDVMERGKNIKPAEAWARLAK